MNTDALLAQLKHQIEELVKRGGDLRSETAKLVAETSDKFYHATDGLRPMIAAVADGAVAGAKATVADDSAMVLSTVMNGVTDGLLKSAQAVRLTLEEATASGTRFANEDLTKIAQDFRGVSAILAEIVTGAAHALGDHVKTQAQTVAEHAKQTLQNAWPPLEQALHAAQHDPVKLGIETVQVGAGAARQAAGVLFGELGNYLQKAGEQLRG